MFSTSEGYHDSCGRYHEYTLGVVQYIRGIQWVHREGGGGKSRFMWESKLRKAFDLY